MLRGAKVIRAVMLLPVVQSAALGQGKEFCALRRKPETTVLHNDRAYVPGSQLRLQTNKGAEKEWQGKTAKKARQKE